MWKGIKTRLKEYISNIYLSIYYINLSLVTLLSGLHLAECCRCPVVLHEHGLDLIVRLIRSC